METTKEKIYIVMWESNVDGERLFDATPCRTHEAAMDILEANINEILTNGHFADADMDDCTIEADVSSYFITDETDDYWEHTYIKEKYLIG